MPPILRAILKLNEQVLGVTLLSYLLGFIITNLYLGTLGLLTFELLRVKYIVTGVLFLLFLSMIFLPFIGALRFFQTNKGNDGKTKLSLRLFKRLATYTLSVYTLIFFVGILLAVLSGAVIIFPPGIPGFSPQFSFVGWLTSAPFQDIFIVACVSWVIGMPLIFAEVVKESIRKNTAHAEDTTVTPGTPGTPTPGDDPVDAGAPSDTAQLNAPASRPRSRLGRIVEQVLNFHNISRTLLYGLVLLPSMFIFLCTLFLLLSLTTNGADPGFFPMRLELEQNGWFKFIVVSFLIYFVLVLMKVLDIVTPTGRTWKAILQPLGWMFDPSANPSTEAPPNDGNRADASQTSAPVPGDKNTRPVRSGRITADYVFSESGGNVLSLVLLFFLLVVPVYVLGVYPDIPQQVGGGGLIQVEIQPLEAVIPGFMTESERAATNGETEGSQRTDPPQPDGTSTANDGGRSNDSGGDSTANQEQSEVALPARRSGIDLFLVDRTSSHTFILVVDRIKFTQSAVEVANSEIKTMTYRQPRLSSEQSKSGERVPVLVTQVLSGDTIEVSVNWQLYIVKYIGLEAPSESTTSTVPDGVSCTKYAEALAANKALVEGRFVWIERDVSDVDEYGRLLRYVYSDDVLVNEELLAHGYAQASIQPPDVKYAHRLVPRELEARAQSRGIWKNGCQPPPSPTPLLGGTYTPSANILTAGPQPESQPEQNSSLTLVAKLLKDGKPVPDAAMEALWYYPTLTVVCAGVTNAAGTASCAPQADVVPSGQKVVVDVIFTAPNMQRITAQTSFTVP